MAYQIPYHTLDAPLNPPILSPEYSSLHTLYPGVPMPRTDVFDRYYYCHSCPKDARRSFEERRSNTIKAAEHLEKLARLSAGGPDDKVTIHAVADPSEIVEDPALSQLSTQSPVALNDGMEYPVKTELDPHHKKLIKSRSKENFEAVGVVGTPDTSKGKCFQDLDVVYVLVFIGFLVFMGLLAGALLGKKKQ